MAATRRNVLTGSLAIAALAPLTGCGGMRLNDFDGTEPALKLEDYFLGRSKAWGVFHDRFGKLRRRFVVDIDGVFDGRTLTLTEDFVYDDGERQQRIWEIEVLGDGRYRGRAGDVIGAAEGQANGAGLTWAYDVDLEVGDDTWRVHFDDWLIQIDEDVVYNRASVRKWGFEIGVVTLFFKREPEAVEGT